MGLKCKSLSEQRAHNILKFSAQLIGCNSNGNPIHVSLRNFWLCDTRHMALDFVFVESAVKVFSRKIFSP